MRILVKKQLCKMHKAFSPLFVVFRPRLYLKTPVQLLAEHHPGKLMGECHRGHGKTFARLLHLLAQPKGASYKKGDGA